MSETTDKLLEQLAAQSEAECSRPAPVFDYDIKPVTFEKATRVDQQIGNVGQPEIGGFELDITPPKEGLYGRNKKVKYVDGQLYEYELYPIIDRYDPILRTPSAPFVFSGPDRTPILPRMLAVSLIETMKLHYGIGLSAIQCGIPYNVFVMGSEGVGYACFNPQVLETEGEVKGEEGCLTFPGLFLPIKRASAVTLKYQDMNGEEKTQRFTGLTARVILHEYDHCMGRLYTSLVSPIILDRCKGKVKKNLKLLEKQRLEIEKKEIIRKATERVVLDKAKENLNAARPWLSEAED